MYVTVCVCVCVCVCVRVYHVLTLPSTCHAELWQGP